MNFNTSKIFIPGPEVNGTIRIGRRIIGLGFSGKPDILRPKIASPDFTHFQNILGNYNFGPESR